MKEGIHTHKSWYKGLNESSNFEDVQVFLHRKHPGKSKCDAAPCIYPAKYKEDASLFCFSIVQKDSYEMDIMKVQQQRHAGIFGCDGNAVLSATTPFLIGEVQTIEFKGAEVGVSKDGTAANTELFMHAWHAVNKHSKLAGYDWTIKVDPDAVLLAGRLRQRLAPLTGSRHYVRNCNLYPEQIDFPMMYGSLEIFSKLAVQAYFDGEQDCKSDLAWQTWGEDYFLGHCLDHLGVTPIDDFGVISDGVCMGADCMDTTAAAFHPFKSVDSWTVCWNLAQEQEARLATSSAPRRISGAMPIKLPEQEHSAFDALEAPARLPPILS
jgi:hypothetical protein